MSDSSNIYIKSRVRFRDFEDRDVDFIYKAKNSRKIKRDIVKDIQEFTYEDAIKWVQGCMRQDSRYKFWAISTNDEFENIVGWCGISSIDYENRKVCARGVTIVDPRYNDGIAWYETYMFMSEYVFDILKFNRFYTITLTSNVQSMMFNERLFLNTREGLLKQAILKNGVYHDVAIHAILKDQYEVLKKGNLSIDNYLENFKKILNSEVRTFHSVEDFVDEIKLRLSCTDASSVNKDSCFRDWDEWSSLFAMDLYAMMEKGFNKCIDVYRLNECNTLGDLYNLCMSGAPLSVESGLSVEFEEDINDIKGF